MQIRHGRGDGLLVRGGEHLLRDGIGQRAHQRDALGGGEGQVEAVHTHSGERPPPLAVGCDAVVQPGRRHRGIVGTSGEGGSVQATQTSSRF
jgi:hypothetical protein